jgi:anti-sigma factor RsiW
MKPCTEYRESIALLAARTLDAAAKENTERHLESCAACRAHFEKLRRVCGQLDHSPRELPSGELPANFHRRLMERIRADVEAPEAPSASVFDWVRAWFSWPRVVYAGAVAVVIVAGLFWNAPHPRTNGSQRTVTSISPPPDGTPPAPTLMALSRALQESEVALDSLLAKQERLLAANDPPSSVLGRSVNGIW